jgi:uncharacterized protein (TIGR02996 family)
MESAAVAFLQTIAEHPNEDAHRLIFADWLEEHGDWRAEFLRLDCTLHTMTGEEVNYPHLKERWAELRGRLPASWNVALDRTPIEGCGIHFNYQCPLRWEGLSPTGVATVRFCNICQESVYYCSSVVELREHHRRDHCVAVDPTLERHPHELWPEGVIRMGLLECTNE